MVLDTILNIDSHCKSSAYYPSSHMLESYALEKFQDNQL
jgi:hypothetical protein